MVIMIGLIAKLLELLARLPIRIVFGAKKAIAPPISECAKQGGMVTLCGALLLLLLIQYLDDCFAEIAP